MSVIQKLLPNHSTNWKCFCNKKADVLQQGNGYDCGVFVCMYARALAFGDPLIEPCSVPGFREGMIVELHEQKANPVPATGPEPESYYVVDYVNKYYIGRLLAIESGLLRFKFLHSSQCKGSTTYYWPRRDDINMVHPFCLVYGPVQLEGCDPFTVKGVRVDQLFESLKKQRNV